MPDNDELDVVIAKAAKHGISVELSSPLMEDGFHRAVASLPGDVRTKRAYYSFDAVRAVENAIFGLLGRRRDTVLE